MAQKIEIHIVQDDSCEDYAYIQLFGDTDPQEDNAAGRVFNQMINAVVEGADKMTRIEDAH